MAYENTESIAKKLPNLSAVVALDSIDTQYFIELIPAMQAQLISVRGTANMVNPRKLSWIALRARYIYRLGKLKCSQSFRILLTPLTYIPIGEASASCLFTWM